MKSDSAPTVAQVVQNDNVSHEIDNVKSIWINGVDILTRVKLRTFILYVLLAANCIFACGWAYIYRTTQEISLNKTDMSKLITLGVRLKDSDYAKIKARAEDLGMSLSQFGENSIMTCLELIESKPTPKLTKFLKGSRYWVHQAEKDKIDFEK